MAIYTDFAYGILLTGITSSETSCTLKAGHGARFGTGEWKGVIWDTYYSNASEAYQNGFAERVTGTSNGTDTITLSRSRGGDTALNFNRTGRTYEIALVTSASDFSAGNTTTQFGADVSCIEGSNSVTFSTAFDDDNYAVDIRIQTSSGEWVLPRSVAKTASGFTFISDSAGTFDWKASR